jgi:probable F420-dependent oxidoreductase
VEYGICLPNYPAGASPEGIDAAAEVTERLGWSTVWTTDHVLVDRGSAGDYGRIFESILTLAWVAARHAKVKLGTSILVVPQRNAVVLAKELASLDVLSGGRVVAGVGVGWNQTEFANLGVADRFKVRGAYLDETIRLWRHLWSGSGEPFRGRFHSLHDFVFGPLPAQGDRLPVLVGGRSEAALERAGTLGDGYHSSAIGPDGYARRVPIVKAAAEKSGRAMSFSARVNVRFGQKSGSGYAMRGTPAAVAEQVRAFADAGVTELALNFGKTDARAIVDDAETFAREVAPLAQGELRR